MYLFDTLTVEGESLHSTIQKNQVSPAETEDLLRLCVESLPKVPAFELNGLPLNTPIPADLWEGLGKIRDGVISLVEKVLGPDHGFTRELQFESLEEEKKKHLSRNFKIMGKLQPAFLCLLAKNAISIIKDGISDSSSGA